MGEFRMPSLGADMEQGTLVEWRVAPGDSVRRGDIVAVVDTDKATIDVEVFESGVVQELLVEPGATVPVGTPLARIGTGAAPAAAEPVVAEPVVAEPVVAAVAEPVVAAVAAPAPAPGPVPEAPARAASAARHHASVVLSPLVRHLAEELGVDTARVEGTGPGGRVTRDDVVRAATAPATSAPRHRATPRARRLASGLGVDAESLPGGGTDGTVRAADVPGTPPAAPPPTPPPTPAPAPGGPAPQVDRGAAMARTMERAWREIPHFRVALEIDLEPMFEWLGRLNEGRPPAERVLPAAVLLGAVARAAAAVPGLNGWWRDGAFVESDTVDVGVVVALRDGLLVPTLAEADRRGPEDLMAALAGLVDRARRGSLRSGDLTPASITVTNLGDQGVDEVDGIVHPPQVALVGFGRIAPRPVAAADGTSVVVHRTVRATLSADHRVTDGRRASRFLRSVDTHLSRPDPPTPT